MRRGAVSRPSLAAPVVRQQRAGAKADDSFRLRTSLKLAIGLGDASRRGAARWWCCRPPQAALRWRRDRAAAAVREGQPATAALTAHRGCFAPEAIATSVRRSRSSAVGAVVREQHRSARNRSGRGMWRCVSSHRRIVFGGAQKPDEVQAGRSGPCLGQTRSLLRRDLGPASCSRKGALGARIE
jgi:hypothetical protein